MKTRATRQKASDATLKRTLAAVDKVRLRDWVTRARHVATPPVSRDVAKVVSATARVVGARTNADLLNAAARLTLAACALWRLAGDRLLVAEGGWPSVPPARGRRGR